MKKYIPNTITLLNLLCGLIAIFQAIDGNFLQTIIWVSLGIFFDFFDGFFARLLNVKSEIGLQLDSLADMVTSGVVPSVVMYKLFSQSHFVVQNIDDNQLIKYLPYCAMLIALASAYRLANFNVDTKQSEGFIGLPTPANALLIVSLPFSFNWVTSFLHNIWFLFSLTLLSSYLLNSEIRLIALKFKNYQWNKDNAYKYLLLLFSLLSLAIWKEKAILIIISFYIGISILADQFDEKQKKSLK